MMEHRVLLLVNSFDVGGSERQTFQLTRALSDSGRYRVHLACLNAGGALRAEVASLDLGEIREYPLTSFHDGNMVVQLRRLRQYLNRERIAIVQSSDFYTNIFGMAAAAAARTPVRIAARRESAMRPAAQRYVERWSYRLAHTVVANCEEVRRQLIEEGVPARKITTVYNGLDMGRVAVRPGLQREDVLASYGLPRGTTHRFITIVANMRHAVKDHPTFLRAARQVSAIVPDAMFLLAGEGELTASLRALAVQLGLERKVFFLGRCERVAELLAISDVCVLSSKMEGFANAILEYMAASRPVVATDVGGAREAVTHGETGYLVQPGDNEAMAMYIITLLSDPDHARLMGSRARSVIEAKFSAEAHLARSEDLYARLIGSVAPARLGAIGATRSAGAPGADF
jgi:glycosyltransferase involved in cell wall biosynthesis